MKMRKRPRSLVVGASGQLGTQIVAQLGLPNVIPTSRFSTDAGWIELDLAGLAASPDRALELLRANRVESVYCVGGMTDVERCESEPALAHSTNCSGPATLAAAAASLDIPFVFISTEYVFDGLRGPYHEDMPSRPLSVYGESKWQGELAVRRVCPRVLIIRTTVVYGLDPRRKNFLYSLSNALRQGRPVKVASDQISTPTYNRDLAAATIRLLEDGMTGVFHVCGEERLSRLEFARRAAIAMGLDPGPITGVTTAQLGQKACRPLQAGLSVGRLNRTYPDLRMRSIEQSIADWKAADPDPATSD